MKTTSITGKNLKLNRKVREESVEAVKPLALNAFSKSKLSEQKNPI